MIKKYIKPLIITLTAFVALFVATGAYASGGFNLWMMPDIGKLNNSSTSVHMLYQLFGPLITEVLGSSSDVDINGYLFAYMLKYWNFLIASGAGVFITYHLILAFVKSAENGKFLAGEAEKVGSILRYALGGFFVAPVIGTGKFCAMQMLFMYGILTGVHAANLLWGTASYGISMGVTPTIPSNVTSTINTVAGEMYLYDMIDQYTADSLNNTNFKADGCKPGDKNAICRHKVVGTVVDLENQPGFESVGNALLNEHSYHFTHNLGGILAMYGAKCDGGSFPDPITTKSIIDDTKCPAFDAWVLKHTVKLQKPSTIKYSCNQNERLTKDSPPHCYTTVKRGFDAGYDYCNSRDECTDQVKADFCSKQTPTGKMTYLETGDWSNSTGTTIIACAMPSERPADKSGQPAMNTYSCTNGYKPSHFGVAQSTYDVTQDSSVTTENGVCLPDMNSPQKYTNGEWVIDSGVSAMQYSGPNTPKAVNVLDGSDRSVAAGDSAAGDSNGFETVLNREGTPSDSQDDATVSGGGLVTPSSSTSGVHRENKKEAALIAPLGMNLGAIPMNYSFPITAGGGSPLYYGWAHEPVACPVMPHGKGTGSGTFTPPATKASCSYQCDKGYKWENGKCNAPPPPPTPFPKWGVGCGPSDLPIYSRARTSHAVRCSTTASCEALVAICLPDPTGVLCAGSFAGFNSGGLCYWHGDFPKDK